MENCLNCGAPPGVIGWLCNCWIAEGEKTFTYDICPKCGQQLSVSYKYNVSCYCGMKNKKGKWLTITI